MTITGTGNLTGDVRPITLKNGVVKVDGVVEILVKEGQDVTPGMPVAVVNVNKSNGSEEGQPSGNSGTNVTAQVSGTVEKIYVSSGQNVKKGEVLIKLSSSNISDAQIQSDKIKVMQAQNNYNQILKQIESLKIYSPIDGKILSQNTLHGFHLMRASQIQQ